MNIWSRNQLGSPNPRPRTHIGRSCSLQPWSKSSMKITSGNKSCQHHFRNRRLCCNPHSHITMAFPKNWLLTGSAKFAKQILQPCITSWQMTLTLLYDLSHASFYGCCSQASFYVLLLFGSERHKREVITHLNTTICSRHLILCMMPKRSEMEAD